MLFFNFQVYVESEYRKTRVLSYFATYKIEKDSFHR